ncbi:MAG TPA: uroporphyrinogen decarboxylase family protein [Phycisphaerae bacterium]|nr:uroporphyrinogen decarboxylase family protein [Phycisphaerae bacterium]
MTSRERLLTALRRGRPDRVPVTIYEHSPFNDDWANEEPSYGPLLELQRRYGDSFVFAPVESQIFLGDPNAVRGRQERQGDGAVVRVTEIETPKGPLRSVTRRDPGLMTNWQVEPLIKSDADIERVLSIPDPPDNVDARRLRDLEARVGDAGVLCFSVGDAIGHVVGLFDFEDFVMRCHDDDGPIRALLARAQELVLRAIRAIGEVVSNAAIRLWGPEYCGAPLLNPHVFFPRYVIEQDREATRLIHASNNFSVIHCHGRLRDILDMIGEIGADALEPIETLPMTTADVTLGEVKERLGSRMCLMGAVQARTLEAGTPEDIRREVRTAIAEGADGGGLVLFPTSSPFMVPLDPKCLANAEAMFLAAHEFGRYSGK